jgi:ABC-type oligopeptide transport system substrate-binding subunit
MVSLALTACGGGGTTSSNLAADQTLKFPILDDVHTLDPGVLDAETDSEFTQNLFNGLLKFDNNLNLVPDIASEMPAITSDGKNFTFKLRHDVTFWNGDKVTAKDFLYSWNRAAALQQSSYDISSFQPILGFERVSNNKVGGAALQALLEKKDPSVWMEGATAPDDYTIKVQLTSPATWWLSAITVVGTAGDVIDSKVVAKDFDNWWSNPATAVGTGAYKLTARTAKASMEFTAVDNWWGTPKPTVKKVHVDVISDQATAIAKYEQGGYDIFGFGGYSGATSVADVKRIQASANEKDQLHIQARARTMWISFNMVADSVRPAKGPFTLDQGKSAHDLRLAFALAVDKKKLIEVVCSNVICSPMTGGIIAKNMPGYLGDDADPLAKFDPAQAKQLLQSADPTGAKTKGLIYVYDPEQPIYRDTAPFLQDQWQTNLGVKVELQKQSHSAFIKSRLKGSYVLARDGWLIDYPHPQDYYDGLYGKNAGCPDANCTSGYDTKAFDDLAAKANALPLDQGLPIYKQMAQMLIDDVVYIPLANFAGVFLWKPYVKGIGANASFEWFWNQYQIYSH